MDSILYCTQSTSIAFFYSLSQRLRSREASVRHGFILSDQYQYIKTLSKSERCGIESTPHVTEWNIYQDFLRLTPEDKAALRKKFRMERGDFFNVGLELDRRLLWGPYTKVSVGLNRYAHSREEIRDLYYFTIERCEALFDKLDPKLVLGFLCTSMLEYAAYFISKRRGIRYLSLRSAKIFDYCYLSESLVDPLDNLAERFSDVLTKPSNFSPEIKQAERYFNSVGKGLAHYEGVRLEDKASPSSSHRKIATYKKLPVAFNFVKGHLKLWITRDPSYANPLKYRLLNGLTRIRRFIHLKWLERIGLDPSKFDSEVQLSYDFFPLHAEPEISLQLYGRPFDDQYSVIRYISSMMNHTDVLIVKEHPEMYGRRPTKFYRDLCALRNVALSKPSVGAYALVSGSRIVHTITSSVANIALVLGKPIAFLGRSNLEVLPDHLAKKISISTSEDDTLERLTSEFRSDKDRVIAYFAAIISLSGNINLYSTLLGKKSVVQYSTDSFSEAVDRLHFYLSEKINSTGATL